MSDFSISFPEDRRFDDRQLHTGDNGADFEAFVYESLSLSIDSHSLRPGFGRGRDGAIDHFIEGESESTIVECKFIGRHSTDTPQHRWNEVRRNLKNNLPRLDGRPNGPDSPYAPWLNQQYRIGSYLFCVAFPFAHVEARVAVEKQIADDFLELSREAPGLSHLADIRVASPRVGRFSRRATSTFCFKDPMVWGSTPWLGSTAR